MRKMKFWGMLSLILLAGTLICGCASEEAKDYGDILEVEVTEEDTTKADKENVFTPVEDDLGYQYRKINHPRAYMSFNVPANWEVKVENARHIRINAPDDDPTFPGLTIHALSSYALGGVDYDTVGMYGKVFESELLGFTYNIDGQEYRQAVYQSPASQDTDTSFSGRGDMLSTAKFEDVNMIQTYKQTSPKGTCNSLQYYVRWAQFPMVFSTVYKEEMQENVERLLTYMVSSITYELQTTSSAKTVSYDGLTTAVPANFEISDKENVFICPYNQSDICAGMGVGVFRTGEVMDEEKIMFEYADSIASNFLPSGTFYNHYGCFPTGETAKVAGKVAQVYTASCSLMPENAKAGDFYQPGDSWYMTIYALPEDDDGQRLIVIWAQDSQVEKMDMVKKLIEDHTKID